jgi:hypothetical protein
MQTMLQPERPARFGIPSSPIRINRVLPILLHEALEEELRYEHVLMPREVDPEDEPMDRLDSDPDPRVRRPDPHIRLVDQECLHTLHIEEDLVRLVPLYPIPDGRVASPPERIKRIGYSPEAQTQEI